MIHAVFERKNGRLCGVTIQGHAGYARAGKDIVCAAVSSALQYATILITESFHEQDEESAEGDTITVRLKTPDKGNASRVLEGLCQHLKFLSEDYPGTIEIEILEV
jgi:uncharacterized protein YsxB (DUF464 family)